MLETELEIHLKQNGAALVGFSALGDKAPAELGKFPFAVTIVRKLSDAVVETIDGKPTLPYFQHYRITNTKLDLLALCAISSRRTAMTRFLSLRPKAPTPTKKRTAAFSRIRRRRSSPDLALSAKTDF